MRKRTSLVERKTKETDIKLSLTVDGSGKSKINTGIPFLDHMLESFSKHGLFDIHLKASGDMHVDSHHTNEDVGIALGEAFKIALGNKKAIRRFADFRAPLDEALSGVRLSLDLSGRGSCHFHTNAKTRWIDHPSLRATDVVKGYSFLDMRHFLESFSTHVGMTLHVDFVAGSQPHHVIEATFKSLAKALDMACQLDPRVKDIPSTKGAL